MNFWKLVDIGLSSCSPVVLILRVKIGAFWGCDVTPLMEQWGEFYPIIVDDFESYTDDSDAGKTIFHTWLDGGGYKKPAPGYPGNGTGALVGYWQPPHAEVDIVHGGYQALPLSYDNDGTLFDGTDGEITGLALYSEAQRVWEVPQDWTVKGVELLTLWFYGGPGNAVEPFYVALEDSAGNRKEVEHPNPAAVTIERWEQWAIPLVDFAGVDMRTVKMMGIGVGDPTSNQPSGTGLVRVDDIELHLP